MRPGIECDRELNAGSSHNAVLKFMNAQYKCYVVINYTNGEGGREEGREGGREGGRKEREGGREGGR